MIVISVLYRYNVRRKNKQLIKKEDRLKYTDMLTSLKNRNYLNDNMKMGRK